MTEDVDIIPTMDTTKLTWTDAPYSNGKIKTATATIDGVDYHYLVRRSAPHHRTWLGWRDGSAFNKAYYNSQELALEACEDDAIKPKRKTLSPWERDDYNGYM